MTVADVFQIFSAVNEVEAGAIQSFTVFENGTLSGAISSTSTGGNGPAHVFASPDGEVSAMNVSPTRLGHMNLA
jgi:hypothetical protein